MDYLQPIYLTDMFRKSEAAFKSGDLGFKNIEPYVHHRYQSLVTLGKITYHEDQVRLVMQLRKLQRELTDYAPPALSARLLRSPESFAARETPSDGETPWWKFSPDEETIDRDVKALATRKTHAEEIASLTSPKGLLLTGPPGSGKSFVVDLWYSTLSTPYKTRKHYNQLVLEIYRSVWEETQRRMQDQYSTSSSSFSSPTQQDNSQGLAPWNRSLREQWRALVGQNGLPSKWTRFTPIFNRGYTDQTIAFTVAKRLVLRHWLLVFDEIQLLDVSSAGLLSDVLSWYWRMGGVIVGTSNKVPDDLYKNGVQRERLEPFVEALKARCPVVELDVKRDWREEMGKLDLGVGSKTWFTTEQKPDFVKLLKQLSNKQPGEGGPRDLHVFGRKLRVPWAHGSVGRFTFPELCEESLGAADYLTLASTFSHVIITDIPVLPLSSKNQARRFISLIDALYESRCKLVCLAAASPESIFFPDSPHSEQALQDVLFAETITESQEYYRPNVSYYDAPEMQTEIAQAVDGSARHGDLKKDAVQLEELSIFSGKDEQFAFKRALSRIREMTSEVYNQRDEWAPLPADERKWESKSKTASSLPAAIRSAHSGTSDSSEGCDDLQNKKAQCTPPALHCDKAFALNHQGEQRADLGRLERQAGAPLYHTPPIIAAAAADGATKEEVHTHQSDLMDNHTGGIGRDSAPGTRTGGRLDMELPRRAVTIDAQQQRHPSSLSQRAHEGQEPTYSSTEAMSSRPYAPRIRPDLHVWGMSEQSEQWGSLDSSGRVKNGEDKSKA